MTLNPLPVLLRLMHRAQLSRSMRLGPEDQIAIEVANNLRAWTLEGRLRAIWWHTANEVGVGKDRARAEARMALAKALGMIPGTPDLILIGWGISTYGTPPNEVFRHRVQLIELKSKVGSLTANQKDFKAWAQSADVAYTVCRSPAEVETVLIDSGLLLPPRGSTAHA